MTMQPGDLFVQTEEDAIGWYRSDGARYELYETPKGCPLLFVSSRPWGSGFDITALCHGVIIERFIIIEDFKDWFELVRPGENTMRWTRKRSAK